MKFKTPDWDDNTTEVEEVCKYFTQAIIAIDKLTSDTRHNEYLTRKIKQNMYQYLVEKGHAVHNDRYGNTYKLVGELIVVEDPELLQAGGTD